LKVVVQRLDIRQWISGSNRCRDLTIDLGDEACEFRQDVIGINGGLGPSAVVSIVFVQGVRSLPAPSRGFAEGKDKRNEHRGRSPISMLKGV
jgi:hypothetical protein